MTLNAELGSLAATLDGLLERVTLLAASVDGSDEDLGPGLNEVERNLASAGRRLARILREVDRRS